MRVRKIPESGPKRRLLDAAESLFAERGFEAVSVRDITKQAGANVAALNYHFGSSEDLIDLLIHHYADPIHEERLVRLEALEKKWSGKTIPLEEVCEAYLRPLQSQSVKSKLTEPVLQKLLGRMLALPCGSLAPVAQQLVISATNRYLRALSKALPALTSEELSWRAHFVEGAMIQMLMGRDPMRGTIEPTTLEALISRLIRFAVAGLRDGVESDAPAKKGPQATFDF